jgi:glutamine amidotransferase
MRVGVINYGVGNLGSVLRALEELRVVPILIKSINELESCQRLILPGVGNFGTCAALLREGGWVQALRDEVIVNKKSLLGICLGMQLLATTSSESDVLNSSESSSGLNLIPGRVESLEKLGCDLQVPHVGWNSINCHSAERGIFDKIQNGTDFYFVHSYAFIPDNVEHVLATTDYGVQVTAAVRRDNVWGVQFHPEKSSRAGVQLLRNFLDG